MAAPQIDLPSDDDLGRISENPTLFGNKEDSDGEKTRNYIEDSSSASITKESASKVLEENSPISYHYLTFETALPSPSTSFSTDGQVAPPQPDLVKYTSPFDWPESRKNFMISFTEMQSKGRSSTRLKFHSLSFLI